MRMQKRYWDRLFIACEGLSVLDIIRFFHVGFFVQVSSYRDAFSPKSLFLSHYFSIVLFFSIFHFIFSLPVEGSISLLDAAVDLCHAQLSGI